MGRHAGQKAPTPAAQPPQHEAHHETVRHAHRIHVMANGVLTEQGTHEELVEHDGIYAGLWKVQTGMAVGAAGAD